MHDIRTIRDNPAAFDAALARRGIAGLASHILALDEVRRDSIQGSEDLLAQRNAVSKAVGDMIRSGADSDLIALRKQEVVDLKSEIERLGNEAKESETRLQNLLLTIPNLPYDDVPTGTDDHGNVEIRRHGAPRNFAFTPVEHYDIKAVAAQMDFATAAKLSGARFVVLTGATARVHRALAQFMLDTHVDDHGLQETITPVLVRPEMMYGTGQLPKFGEDSYETTNGWWLIPTAEVTLTNMVNGDTVEENTLPRRYVAHTNCFRSEAGSAGRDTAGMLRQHQFEKVEMVSITTPDQSEAEHKRMTECAQNILEKLGLAYRTMILCTGDMGAGARRTHDLEVWLPGQNTYREISSVSTCGDYQARRMNARFKPRAGGKPEFVHTLNGSGLAVGRTLIAVLENGQNEDGSVTLPAVLHHYLGGKTTISAEGQLT